jgi:flavorubredoxin
MPRSRCFTTGMRGLFPLGREAIETVMPLERLRWIGFAHVEADECGAVNEFLEVAPHAIEITTPHVPHNWESHMFLEQETGTLFSGDLVTQIGDGPAITSDDLVDAAIAAEEIFHQTSIGPAVPAAYRRLADLNPQRLAVMHGSSYEGDCATLLRTMADVYENTFGCGGAKEPSQSLPGHKNRLGVQAETSRSQL